MSTNKEIAAKLRAQAVLEAAHAAEDSALADELDPPAAPPSPAPAPIEPTHPPGWPNLPPAPPPAPQPAPAPTMPPPSPQPAPIPPVDQTMSARRAFIERTMGMHYGYRGVPEATLASLPQSYPPGSSGAMVRGEGGTGERDEIGIVPGFSALSIISDDPRAIGHALANAKTSLTEFAVHVQDAKTRAPIKFNEHPKTTLQQAVGGDVVFTDDATDVQLDLQHVPHPLFVPFLTAIYDKDRATAEWLLTEMKYWAGMCFLKQPAQARKFGDFLVNPQASINSGRGAAWVLVWIFQTLAAIQLFQKTFGVVDEYEASYRHTVEQNAAFYRGKYIDGTWDESYATPYYDSPKGTYQNTLGMVELGAFYGGFNDGLARAGAFQAGFVASAWGFLRGMVDAGTITVSDQAKADIIAVTNFVYSLAVAMAGDGTNGTFDIRRLGRYTVAVGYTNRDGTIRKFANLAEMAANNERDLPPLPPWPTDRALRQHDINALLSAAGPFGAGYVVDWVPPLAMAVRDGYPGAAEAWARLEMLDDWKATRNTLPAKYAILPPGKYLDDPVAAPQPSPAPTPAPSPGNPPQGAKLADENGSFTLAGPALVRYGADTRWVEKQLGAGTYIANNALFGDPASGTVKALYMGGASAPAPTPQATPAPTPAPQPPQPPQPPAPGPSRGAPAAIAGAGDALFAALPVGQWAANSSTDTIRKAVQRFSPDYIEHGNTGLTALTDAWSGACLDPMTGRMYGQGGGHYDSNFNGVYGVDLETGACTLPVKPTILSNAQANEIRNSWAPHGGWVSWGQGVWPANTFYDGKPGAIHTYGSIWFVDGKMVMPGRIYDLAAGTVELFASACGSPSNMGLRIGDRLISVNNLSDQYWDIVQIEYGTKTETISNFSVPYKPGIGAPYSFNGETYCCAIGSMLYFVKMDSPSVDFPAPLAWSIDATTVQQNYVATVQTPINPWSAADMTGCQMNTMALDTDTNVLYIPARDWSYFLTWNPLTAECGKVAIAGDLPPKTTNSAYGRFQHYAKRKCFVLVNSIDEPIYYIRLGVQ